MPLPSSYSVSQGASFPGFSSSPPYTRTGQRTQPTEHVKTERARNTKPSNTEPSNTEYKLFSSSTEYINTENVNSYYFSRSKHRVSGVSSPKGTTTTAQDTTNDNPEIISHCEFKKEFKKDIKNYQWNNSGENKNNNNRKQRYATEKQHVNSVEGRRTTEEENYCDVHKTEKVAEIYENNRNNSFGRNGDCVEKVLTSSHVKKQENNHEQPSEITSPGFNAL